MLRLVSLVIGLALVGMMMQMVQSPGAKQKLALMFGGASPVATPADTTPLDDTNAQTESPRYLDSVDRSKLTLIEDNAWLRDEESDAWFHLLDVVRNAEPAELDAASVGEVAYAQLLGQPQVYRGRVVQLDGEAKRIERIKPAENNLGIDNLYLIHIQPSRDLMRPFAIYCQELPTGWSTEGEIPGSGRMTCQALFFKNKVYKNQTGVDLMPVFLTATIAPVGDPKPLVDRTPTMPAWQTASLAALVAAALVAWVALRSGAEPRPELALDAAELADDLQALTAADNETPP